MNPFDELAKAMKRRENCLNALTRWQTQLAEAEADIASLGMAVAAAAAPLPRINMELVDADEVPVVEGVASADVSGLLAGAPEDEPVNA